MPDQLSLDANALADNIVSAQRLALRLSSQLAFAPVPPSPEAQRTLRQLNDTLAELRESAERHAIQIGDPCFR